MGGAKLHHIQMGSSFGGPCHGFGTEVLRPKGHERVIDLFSTENFILAIFMLLLYIFNFTFAFYETLHYNQFYSL